MRLFFLAAAVMVAFAANSVLTRGGVALGGTDPVVFGVLRLWAGAVTLLALCLLQRRRVPWRGPARLAGVGGLVVYIFGFSLAYVDLDAGLGALILFGWVQVTMFAGALIGGERPHFLRWLGALVAFAGLFWVMWPDGQTGFRLSHALLMAAAGVGWGIYSLAGRGAQNPLAATAANFALAAPMGGLLLGVPVLVSPAVSGLGVTPMGITLAVLSGSVSSALGYALWYAVLPHLAGSVAAVAQLTVPVIALLGGVVFLSEPLTWAMVMSSAVVLGGVALSMMAPSHPRRRPGGS